MQVDIGTKCVMNLNESSSAQPASSIYSQ